MVILIRLREHCSGDDVGSYLLHLLRPDRDSVHADGHRRSGRSDGGRRCGPLPAHPQTIQLGQIAIRSKLRSQIRPLPLSHPHLPAANCVHRHRRRHLHDLGGLELSRILLLLLHHHDHHRLRRFSTRFRIHSAHLLYSMSMDALQ